MSDPVPTQKGAAMYPREERAKTILDEVNDEVDAQIEKWGEQNHPNGTGFVVTDSFAPWTFDPDVQKLTVDLKTDQGTLTYADILAEEVAEALAERDPEALRTELTQVAAVCVNWIGKIDRDADST